MKNIPEKIWLNLGEEVPDDADFHALSEVTWSENKVFKNSPVIYGHKVEIPSGEAELVIIPDIEEVYSTTALINKIRTCANTKEPK